MLLSASGSCEKSISFSFELPFHFQTIYSLQLIKFPYFIIYLSSSWRSPHYYYQQMLRHSKIALLRKKTALAPPHLSCPDLITNLSLTIHCLSALIYSLIELF